MEPTKFGQFAQIALALVAIAAVTVLCAIGKIDGASTLLVIVSAGGLSALGSANLHLANNASQQAEQDRVPVSPAPSYDPNARSPRES